MKLILSWLTFFVLLSSAPLPAAETIPPERKDLFTIPETTMPAIYENRSNLRSSLSLHVTYSCFLLITLHLENSLIQGALINPSGDPYVKNTSGYILVHPMQHFGQSKAGDVITLEWTYPSDYLLEYNQVFLSVVCGYTMFDSATVLVDVAFPLRVFHSKNWSLPADGACERANGTGCVVRYPGKLGVLAWRSENRGLASNYQNPLQNRVPLSSALWRSVNFDGVAERFHYTSAYLRLHNDDGSFTIGLPGHNATERWRDFPLALGNAVSSGSFASFRTSEDYAVTPDGRYMRPFKEKSERDYFTHELYLPPVKNEERKTFSFSLIITGGGQNGLDSYHWDFTIEKDKNYFGSVNNSDYTVEVR